MASDRGKLVLDEQSFQGLLAAAYTIQQHTARSAAANGAGADKDATAPSKVEAPVNGKAANPAIAVCNRCGTPLSLTDAACPKCEPGAMRPGERLQRNWASLWQKSQEQGLPLDARRRPEDDLPLSPGDPGRLRPTPSSVASSKLSAATPSTSTPSSSTASSPAPPAPVLRSPTESESMAPAEEAATANAELPAPASEHGAMSGGNSYEASNREQSQARIESNAHIVERIEASEDEQHAEREELMPSWSQAQESDQHESEEAWEEPEAVPQAGGKLPATRLRLRFHRADFFLGLAVIVAATAMLWPVSGQKSPDRPLWQRILIATGLAEAPAQAVHFHGDPDLKVWVDTHTALYYCPGDELYGKSPNGHYTTQREAQADRFEPAERSVCIQ